MNPSLTEPGFSGRRTRSFARLTGYTLLALFLISAVAAFLPPPFARPDRLFTVLGEVLAERSTLPVLALLLLYGGFSGATAAPVWELRLAALLRPVLRLVALLYLLVAIAVVGVAGQLQFQGVAQIDGQLQANLGGLSALRQQVRVSADPRQLRRLLEQQAPLRAGLSEAGSPLADPQAPLEAQRARALQLLDRIEANLRSDDLRRRADAGGLLFKEQLRLVLTSLLLALFYLLSSVLWPHSLGPTIERARAAQASHALADEEAG